MNSLRRAHKIVCMGHSMYYYGEIRLKDLLWNRKRAFRGYRNLNLKQRIKCKSHIPNRIKEKLIISGTVNEIWSIDFMSDVLSNGGRFRVLNVVDDYSRESLINEAFYSISGVKLVQKLKEVISYRPKPKRIRTDNGTEFLSKVCRLLQR